MENLDLIRKARDIAWGVNLWPDDERAMIEAILPGPKAIQTVVDAWVEEWRIESRGHPDDCECHCCFKWWVYQPSAADQLADMLSTCDVWWEPPGERT